MLAYTEFRHGFYRGYFREVYAGAGLLDAIWISNILDERFGWTR